MRQEKTTAGHAVVQLGKAARRAASTSEFRQVVEDGGVDFNAPAAFPPRVRRVKRVFDLFGSTVAMILLAPVFAAVSLLVKVTSRGPVFYHQERVLTVRDGKEVPFRMHKFRTMVADAEAQTGPVWAGERDPRITVIGRFLRKSRLDEIPQFWNVLKGEMSIVGPRPERPHFTEQLKDEIPVYYDRIWQLQPGITGWAQVRCPYDSSLESVKMKLLYDLAYAAHCYRLRSYLKMEIKVVLLTVIVIFTGKGAQ